MKLIDLPTPAVVLDLDAFESNIQKYHDAAKAHDKEIWPMTKTHKSEEIMRYQLDHGATGLLCGTLDECEGALRAGATNIMYAYPVSDAQAIQRMLAVAKKSNFYFRLDDLKVAERVNQAAQVADVTINYTIIINVGLNRFGIEPEVAGEFVQQLQKFTHLHFKGISTHPGHVYGISGAAAVQRVSEEESARLAQAKQAILDAGFDVELVTSGSTPTYFNTLDDENIQIYHPGNYVFHDAIQISMEAISQEEIALEALGSITSNPRPGVYMTDIGAKVLGLDKGAHGNTAIVGHGRIVDHPEAVLVALSEEVGKIETQQGDFQTGDRIQVIPNHSCTVANLTQTLYAVRGDEVVKAYNVDLRGNSINFLIN